MANKNLYQEVIDIITKLNEFIIVMDEKIQKSETNYENRKRQIVLEHQRSLNKFDSDCKIQIQELERNKNSLFKEAQDIKNKIEKIDEDLSRVDKYYIKTKKAKLEELKQKKSDSYSDSSDYFKTLKSIQNKFWLLV